MMCRLLEVSKSAYHAWRRPGRVDARRAEGREEAGRMVLEEWDASGGVMGAWSVWKRLTKRGADVTLWLVRRLMREMGIRGAGSPRKEQTTKQDPGAKARTDLIRRDFTSPVPTIRLAGDITYIRLDANTTLYLAVVIDLCTRMVVGWELAGHMRAELVRDALAKAWRAGMVAIGAIFHSDKGSQYTSGLFGDFAKAISVRLSTGRKATCFDNAVSESFFATLKKEWLYRNSFSCREELASSLARYIEVYYNRRRPHSTLGGNTPAEEMGLHLDYWEATMDKAA